MTNRILFVFEGERTENLVYDSLSRYFLDKNLVITCAYCAEIYQLYEEIKNDPYLDVFPLLKEKQQNKELLADFDRDDFSEIYLFFDYDGHSSLAKDGSVIDLLRLFNEETESGKMFLSYPMVEAWKHYSDKIDFKTLAVEATEDVRYKELVDSEAGNVYKQLKKYDRQLWGFLIDLHLKKMNWIVRNSFHFPDQKHTQSDIFHGQQNKYIIPDQKVAVLSAFPVFLLDYYGVETLKEKLIPHVNVMEDKEAEAYKSDRK